MLSRPSLAPWIRKPARIGQTGSPKKTQESFYQLTEKT